MLTVDEAIDRCRVNADRCTRSEPRRRWERERHPRPEGLTIIGPDGTPNAYPGACCVCRTPVEAFGGELVREGRRVAVVCPSCRFGGVVAVAVRRGVRA
jgi:hypothetical protein